MKAIRPPTCPLPPHPPNDLRLPTRSLRSFIQRSLGIWRRYGARRRPWRPRCRSPSPATTRLASKTFLLIFLPRRRSRHDFAGYRVDREEGTAESDSGEGGRGRNWRARGRGGGRRKPRDSSRERNRQSEGSSWSQPLRQETSLGRLHADGAGCQDLRVR
jgi:hypothetical protein